jgi:tetratricopeptide (TPR) repeat protein
MPRDVHPIPFVIHPSDELGNNIDLKTLSRDLATKYADGHVVTDDDLQIMGRNLWNELSADIQVAFEAARKEAWEKILPVMIHSDAADVQALPWETLFHPTYGFIGKNPDFTLTRRSSAQEATGGLDQDPLRVLLFTSLPANVDPERSRLKVEEEQAEVQAALLPWIAQGLVTLEMPDDGRFSTLQNLLKEFQPHVLFLSGHGNFHHMPHANEAYGEFFFEDEAGDSVGVKEDEIADALRGTGVQAVILSACESGKAASDELSNGLTRKISAAGIPHVVGMREAIYDVAGIQFARALCDSLARQERMDVALQAARIAIQSPFKDVARASSSIGDEFSYGQWCLPLLISSAPSRALIDWDFTPRQVETRAVSQKINTIVMPARFIGRRAEMRKYKNSLLAGNIHSLLITGPGGQGKTSLAGKLALDLQAHGYRLFAWSARPENSWRDFELEMEQTLDRPRVDRYDKFLPRAENESARAQFMLDLLAEQFNGRVALFLDNLETLQDPDTLALNDTTVEAWLRAVNQAQGMILLVTSRWQIPNWNGEHEPLTHVNYGDFLQIAQRLSLPPAFLTRRNSLRQVYDVLGGNVRGLEFFAAAVRDMENSDEENAFLEKISTVKEDLHVNMAIEAIYNRLPTDAKTLLHRLPAFHEPVPMEGLLKLAPDLPNPESMLERLLAVSLLEASYEPHWKVNEYQCPQMVVDWMRAKGLVDDGHEWLNVVADYQLYLHNNERKTLEQAIATHHALRFADRHDEADRLTLKYIIQPLTLDGFYYPLLTEWLPRVCESKNLQVRSMALSDTGVLLKNIGNYDKALLYLGQSLVLARQANHKQHESLTLNNISTVYQAQGNYKLALTCLEQSLAIQQQNSEKVGEGQSLHNIGENYRMQGDYKMALSYFKQSLNISQQIGDKRVEGTTLNNISQIFQTQGDYETSLLYLKDSLAISQQIGNKEGEMQSLNNIGENYRAKRDYETAFSYFKKSLNISQQIGDKRGEGVILNNISLIYHAQGDYETEMFYLKQSLAVRQQIGDKAGEGVTLNNISLIYHAQGDYKTALSYLKQSLLISQQLGNITGLCINLFNMGHLHWQIRQTQEAVEAWANSYLVAKQTGYVYILQMLTKLIPQLELPDHLANWDQIVRHIQNGEKLDIKVK